MDEWEDDQNDPEVVAAKNLRDFKRYVWKNDLENIEAMYMDGRHRINQIDSKGENAVHWAVLNGTLPTMQLLLEIGIDYTQENFKGESPLMTAAMRGDAEIFQLIANEFEVDSPRYGPARPLRSRSHVHQSGQTLLMMACGRTQVSKTFHAVSLRLVQLLLVEGFDPLTVDEKGWNAFHYASESNRRDVHEVVTTLVAAAEHAGASFVDIQNRDGNTVLHIASMNKKWGAAIVKPFLNCDARVNMKNRDGNTPLLLACMNTVGGTVIAKDMLDHGANSADRNSNMETPLHLSVRANLTGAVQFLFDAGADLLARDIQGRTPMHVACELGIWERGVDTWPTMQMLISKCDRRYQSAYLECRDNTGMTPLLMACKQENKRIADELLLIPRIDIDAKNPEGDSVLHMCVSNAWYSTVDCLIKLGVVMMIRNIHGQTPLDRADELSCFGGHRRICRDTLSFWTERLRKKTIAFSMGQHDRLGRSSKIRGLSPEEMDKILSYC